MYSCNIQKSENLLEQILSAYEVHSVDSYSPIGHNSVEHAAMKCKHTNLSADTF